MVKNLLIILFFFYSNFLFSQEFEELYNRIQKFKTSRQFDAIDCEIFIAVGDILSKSPNENQLDASYAMQSLVYWMEGTASYHLITGGKALEDCDSGDVTMRNIFRVCMIDFLFANHDYVHVTNGKMRYINIHEVREIIFGGTQLFMEYLSRQDKKIINKKHKKGLKFYYEGKIQEYLDS